MDNSVRTFGTFAIWPGAEARFLARFVTLCVAFIRMFSSVTSIMGVVLVDRELWNILRAARAPYTRRLHTLFFARDTIYVLGFYLDVELVFENKIMQTIAYS